MYIIRSVDILGSTSILSSTSVPLSIQSINDYGLEIEKEDNSVCIYQKAESTYDRVLIGIFSLHFCSVISKVEEIKK